MKYIILEEKSFAERNILPTPKFKNIVVLTGAGISAESGLSTFRDSNGLWENHRIEDVATPEAFQKDPILVWRFYSMRRLQAAAAKPNIAHMVLTEFAKSHKGSIDLITQNVDGLHQRADVTDSLPTINMHGTLNESRCVKCGEIYLDDHAYFDLQGNYAPQETSICSSSQRASMNYLHQFKLEYKNFLPLSPCCKSDLRPNIVWFGEMPFQMPKIERLIGQADLFVSIGTSGNIYPAAGFLQIAKVSGSHTVCINKETIPQSQWIDESILGLATEKVPEYFKSL